MLQIAAAKHFVKNVVILSHITHQEKCLSKKTYREHYAVDYFFSRPFLDGIKCYKHRDGHR